MFYVQKITSFVIFCTQNIIDTKKMQNWVFFCLSQRIFFFSTLSILVGLDLVVLNPQVEFHLQTS